MGHVVVGSESAGRVVSNAFTRSASAGEHDDKPDDNGCDEGQDEPPHADTMAHPVGPEPSVRRRWRWHYPAGPVDNQSRLNSPARTLALKNGSQMRPTAGGKTRLTGLLLGWLKKAGSGAGLMPIA